MRIDIWTNARDLFQSTKALRIVIVILGHTEISVVGGVAYYKRLIV